MALIKNLLIIIFIILNIIVVGISQKTTAKLQNSNYLSDNNEKYKISKQIIDNILRAIDNYGEQPEFHIIKIDGKRDCNGIGAWICGYPNQAIFLDERLYNICDSYKDDRDNALAFILGHELSHFYKKHLQHYVDKSGKVKLVKQFGYIQIKKPENDIEKKWIIDTLCKVETEADYFGAFYSYVAGYDPRNIMKTLIEDIYNEKDFNIDENNLIALGYLPKLKRICVVDSVAKILKDLIPVFDIANYLLMLKKYELAAICNEYIAQFFPSREIYNNLGLCYALEAIKNDTTAFVYPFEFDPRTRLEEFVEKGWVGLSREELLDSAKKYFELAIQKDTNYLVAKINKSCIFDISGEHQLAIDYCNSILNSSININKISICNLNIVKGIAFSNKAYKLFQDAGQSDPVIARRNYSIFLTNNNANFIDNSLKINNFKIINSLILSDYFYETKRKPTTTKSFKSNEDNKINIYFKENNDWQGFIINNFSGHLSKTIKLLKIKNKYAPDDTHLSEKIGYQINDLIKEYPGQNYTITSYLKNYIIFPNSHLIFSCNDNIVSEIIVFE